MKKKSILLFGLGRFGKHIAIDMTRLGNEVMVIDKNEEKVNDMLPYVSNGKIGNSTNINFLKELGVSSFDLCIVAIGNDFQSSLETTYLLHELKAKKVIARAKEDAQSKFLLNNGADEIVYPEKQLASWMAIRYSQDNILDYIEIDKDFSIFEVLVPPSWVGNTIRNIDIRRKYGVNIIAIKDDFDRINSFIDPDTILTSQMSLFVLGDYKTLKKCFKI